MQRHALQPQPERLPVNGENGFEGHQRDPHQQRTQRRARQRARRSVRVASNTFVS